MSLTQTVGKMPAWDVSQVCKRVAIGYSMSQFIKSKSCFFLPSFGTFEYGPAIRFATKVSAFGKGYLVNEDLIATFDGLDLTVASIESEFRSAECEPSSLWSKSFSLGSNLRYCDGLVAGIDIERNCNLHIVGRHFNYS